jgi:hypothetical protein
MHSHGLYKHIVMRSCPLFFKIYIFSAHIVQNFFLKVMRGLLEAVRVLRGRGSAFRGCESARESASRGLETVAEA